MEKLSPEEQRERRLESHRKYNSSAKGKASQQRYNQSDKGRKRKVKYNHTDKGKISYTKFEHTERRRRYKRQFRQDHTQATTLMIYKYIIGR